MKHVVMKAYIENQLFNRIANAFLNRIPAGCKESIKRAMTSDVYDKRKQLIRLRPDCYLKIHPSSADAFSYFIYNDDQAQELDRFMSVCKTKTRFIDVGAHHGIFSLVFKKCSGRQSKVLAFEPSSNAFKVLKYNIGQNGYQKTVTLFNMAAGAGNGSIRMKKGPWDYLEIRTSNGKGPSESVAQVSLDTMTRRRGFCPDLVKIDVEGYEKEVIEGSCNVLRQCNPTIFLELHNPLLRDGKTKPESILHYLTECGYSFFDFSGHKLSLAELLENKTHRIVCEPET